MNSAAPDNFMEIAPDDWANLAARICARHKIAFTDLRRSSLGENVIFFVDARFVVKIYTELARNEYRRELAALQFVRGKMSIETPAVLHAGDIDGRFYLVMTQIRGTASRAVWFAAERREQLQLIAQLGASLKELHSHAAPLHESSLNRDWRAYIREKAASAVARQRECGANPQWLARLPSYIAERIDLLQGDFRTVFLHGDVHAGNLLLTRPDGRPQINGLIDFGDSFCGFHEYEFVAPGVLMVRGDRDLQRAMFAAYGYGENELNENLRARLMLLTIFYECSNLRKYALLLAPEAVDLTLDELERAIWNFV